MKTNINNINNTMKDIPNSFVNEGISYFNYDKLTELHHTHWWRDVVIWELWNNQKYGDCIIEWDIVTRQIIDLTEDEIEEIRTQSIPQELSRQKLKLALAHSGVVLSNIDVMISQLPEPNKTFISILWNDSANFERQNDTLIQFAQQLWMDEQQLDQIFLLWDTL